MGYYRIAVVRSYRKFCYNTQTEDIKLFLVVSKRTAPMLSRRLLATRYSPRMRICRVPSRHHLLISGEYLVLQRHLHMAINFHRSLCNENLARLSDEYNLLLLICLMGCHSSGHMRHRALSQWRSLAYLNLLQQKLH